MPWCVCVCVCVCVCISVSDFCLARGLFQFKLPSSDSLSIVLFFFPDSNFLSLFHSLHFCLFLMALRVTVCFGFCFFSLVSNCSRIITPVSCVMLQLSFIFLHDNNECSAFVVANTPDSVIAFSWLVVTSIVLLAKDCKFAFSCTTVNTGQPCTEACFFLWLNGIFVTNNWETKQTMMQ